MFTDTNPYLETLDNGLILKSIGTQDELERLAAFNLMIHQEDVLDGMTRALVTHHPNTRPEEWLIVVDPAHDDLIVSSLCQIPWRWRYGAGETSVELKAHEMGIVGTLPDYRRRGLIRALDRRFKALLAESGAHVSQIQGIPYYYRQFGYEYALPLEGGWTLEPRLIPDDDPQPLQGEAFREPDHDQARRSAQGYSFRLATVDDIPLLETFYADMVRDLGIYTVRTAAIWRYLFACQNETADGGEIWIVTGPDGTPAGYLRVALRGFGEGLIVHEAAPLIYSAGMAALAWLKQLAQTRGKPYIRLAMADSNPLIAVAKTLGAHAQGRYAWQLHVPDPAHLLRDIAPVLEARLAASLFAGLTHTLTLDLFRLAVVVRIEEGQIAAVETVAAAEGNAENHVPPNLVAPLVFGWRTRAELSAQYPDFNAWGMTEALFDVLFPRMDAFLYTIY